LGRGGDTPVRAGLRSRVIALPFRLLFLFLHTGVLFVLET